MKARLLGHMSGFVIGRTGEGIWLMCEVTQPPSKSGRPADVYIPSNLIPGLFKALREQMIKDRAQPDASFAHKVVEGLAGR